MYGYEPPKPLEPGGCRDALVITRVAFEVLVPIMLAGIAALALVALTVVLFARHPALALLPLSAVVVALYLLARRDRRLQEEQQRQGTDRPRRGP